MSNQPFEVSEEEQQKISVDFESSMIAVRPERIVIENDRQKIVFFEDDDANIQQILQRCVNSARNGAEKNQENSINIKRSKQPLKMKFKGIIINKVIGEIYHNSQHNFSLHAFAKLRLNMLQRSKCARLTLSDLQRKTREVMLSSLQYVLNLQKLKQLQSGFASITQY